MKILSYIYNFSKEVGSYELEIYIGVDNNYSTLIDQLINSYGLVEFGSILTRAREGKRRFFKKERCIVCIAGGFRPAHHQRKNLEIFLIWLFGYNMYSVLYKCFNLLRACFTTNNGLIKQTITVSHATNYLYSSHF